MTERTLVRASTQIRDDSVTLDKLSPAIRALLTREQVRIDFIAGDGQTELSNAAFNSESTVNVYSNGVLLNPSEYELSEGKITLNVALYTTDQVTVFLGIASSTALNQLDAFSIGKLEYKGTWNAFTNVPVIPTATPLNKGFYYVVNVLGTTNVSGKTDWQVGDWLVSNGISWDKLDSTDAVLSINGRIGAVELTAADVGLTNVDNTSDANKPVSTAQQTALNGKQAYDADLSSLIRQNSQSAAYTCVLTDNGKHIFHPSADTTVRTFTIPANAAGGGVGAFAIGSAITFVNQHGGGVITIAITSDVLYLAGDGTTGNRTLAANGVATALKVTATEWIISGTNLT